MQTDLGYTVGSCLPARITSVHRIVAGILVGLPRRGDHRVDRGELARLAVVEPGPEVHEAAVGVLVLAAVAEGAARGSVRDVAAGVVAGEVVHHPAGAGHHHRGRRLEVSEEGGVVECGSRGTNQDDIQTYPSAYCGFVATVDTLEEAQFLCAIDVILSGADPNPGLALGNWLGEGNNWNVNWP